MAEAATMRQKFMARLVVAVAVALVLLGLAMYGLSNEVFERIWKDIVERPSGPMSFRFILQPCTAAIAALHDGVKDARLGRNPYLWKLLSDAHAVPGRLREGLIATARIILLGLGMDALYQAFVLKTFYPGEMVLVAILLAFIPYVLLRGPFARLAGWWFARNASGS
jgi:hypothetical protein